jgi:hypothetical protein
MPTTSEEPLGLLHRGWIRFWYNTVTRLLFVLLPGYFVGLIPLLRYLEVPPEYANKVLVAAYVGVFLWAMVDNDFSQLNRIGRDVDGNLLPPEAQRQTQG